MQFKNIAWSLVGLGTPLLIAVAIIPALVQTIGMERFGLLTLVWGLIGYAGVFDLGIGRAATQFIAQLRGQDSYAEIPMVIRSAIQITFLTGVIGALLLVLAGILDVQKLIKHSAGMDNEITISFFIIALVVPIQSMSATYRGVSEAFENFRGISVLRMALGLLNFLAPYLVAQYYTTSLPWLVSTLLVSRMVALVVYRHLAIRSVVGNPDYQLHTSFSLDNVKTRKRLFAFGGWITASSIISPVLMQADRFVIATVISATTVATYTIPYEVIVQSSIIAGAITTVAFPSLAKLMHEKPSQGYALFCRWLINVALIMLLVTGTLALLLPVILPLWISHNLPVESVLIGQILCIGVYVYSIGTMYTAFLHANELPKISAIIHSVEVLPYLYILYELIVRFGVYGAALAWVVRAIVDTFLLAYLSNRIVIKPLRNVL
jgi:O-antigen/teichoic acid export membrane protein